MDSNTTFQPNSRVAAVKVIRTITEMSTILVPIESASEHTSDLINAAKQAANDILLTTPDSEFTIVSVNKETDTSEIFFVDEDGELELENPLEF